MAERPVVVVDPYRRRMDEIFSPDDLARLHDTCEVVWGKDEPMPLESMSGALSRALAVVCSGWRYGDVLERASNLRAIIDVAGGFPSTLNYDECYARHIRVLTAAPAFGRQVAEMALAASRDIVAGDRAMREGTEGWLQGAQPETVRRYVPR